MNTRLLIVEDSPTQATALLALLESAGYDVGVAASGDEALAAFEAERWSVVISDIVMPGTIDGYELCRRIKASRYGDTPVVLLTSLSDPLDIIRGLECGADHFLTKPYESEHLLKRLRTLLATRATRGRSKVSMGVSLVFMGREFTISSEREQILDLLVSTFEDAVNQNKHLRQREEVLEATNRELEAFTYAISHDLRAPLRHADGFSKLLLEEFEGRLDEAGQSYVLRIRQAVQHMELMVNELLNLGRVGRRELRTRTTPLRALVDMALAELEGQSRGRPVEWRIGDLPEIECDPDLMESVFANLLANALKFTRGREPAIIEVGTTTHGGRMVIYVRDNGAGFEQQYASRLFGIFQRLHRPEEFEGSGVGLATVQRIVHKHGGQVWAEAELGKGATFFISLPSKATQPVAVEA
ncbi:MAG TPA: response regulator [Gemmatimonadales bacterium]|nr:response regulator [Gemmatimonadales bacterium]